MTVKVTVSKRFLINILEIPPICPMGATRHSSESSLFQRPQKKKSAPNRFDRLFGRKSFPMPPLLA
jgi:hypothetical protein